ncbi:hypothetical protein RF11_06638 [Thelohanellus kitauei]|uniref:Tc1-like transposase DDE domain-containing protein n=1 Tax=Thelohanellus kitauei TaxID=669202 RepID=A0A0C2MSS2_THEKT|nr:hypothetical protein RF11_06638 [Thelohanellus kitauei]
MEHQEKKHIYVNSEKVLEIKKMYEAGASTKSISVATELSRRTVQSWTKKIDDNPNVQPKKLGKLPQTNHRRQREIEILIEANNALTAVGIAKSLPKNFKCSTSTICRQLKSMGYSRKRLKRSVASRNSADVIDQRYIYSTRIEMLPDSEIIFIGETDFNLNTSENYGYAPTGIKPSIIVQAERGTSVNCICAISVTGCFAFRLQTSSFDSSSVAEWCTVDLMPKIQNMGTVVIMDNTRFHHSEVVSRAFDDSKFSVLLLPPYSPQLNPIERFFGDIRNKCRRIHPRPSSSGELLSVLNQIFEGPLAGNFETFFRSYEAMGKYWDSKT